MINRKTLTFNFLFEFLITRPYYEPKFHFFVKFNDYSFFYSSNLTFNNSSKFESYFLFMFIPIFINI